MIDFIEDNPEKQAEVRDEICTDFGTVLQLEESTTNFRFSLIEGTSLQNCRRLVEGMLAAINMRADKARAFLMEASVEPCCCTERVRKILEAKPNLMQKGRSYESDCSCGKTLRIKCTEPNEYSLEVRGVPMDIKFEPFQITMRWLRVMSAEKCLKMPTELNRLSVATAKIDGLNVREELIRIL